jgi:predicted phosphohydrolase
MVGYRIADHPPNFDQIVQVLFGEHWKSAEQAIENHWRAVEGQGGRLLLRKCMPKKEAFNLIEAYLAKNSAE